MGSSSSFHLNPCIPFLLAMCLLLGPISVSSTEKVTVSLYYESLCPYCANFIVNSLVKVFQKGLNSVVHLRLIPWGNSWIQSNGSFSCQHGPDECLLNTIQACAINIYPNVNQHFRFVYCIERLRLEGKHTEWGRCLGVDKMGRSPIDCYNNGRGHQLERKYAEETDRLKPPLRFVPWVIVNGHALQEDFPNFVRYVCQAYKGRPLPEACTSIQSTDDSLEEISFNSVCYAGEHKNSTSLQH
ncbi:hypothetical protein SAY87_010580 [Trapa incisa]|uniref:Gamma-interferon-inducible lysosomal thiol reductase n=1 Tax=Trapa incisa TaxID=236973 RepID=A0AAN7GHB2_9MYRT|nr:hypothetical protein SAY87_010580 [Trapa incisa]